MTGKRSLSVRDITAITFRARVSATNGESNDAAVHTSAKRRRDREKHLCGYLSHHRSTCATIFVYTSNEFAFRRDRDVWRLDGGNRVSLQGDRCGTRFA
jgi:hypothetical protein